LANKARDLILAVIDGTPYENGKLKPAVRELDEYIEGLEEELVKARAENEKEVSLHKGARSQLVAMEEKWREAFAMCGMMRQALNFALSDRGLLPVTRDKITDALAFRYKSSDLCKICQHSKHGGVECGVSTEPIGDRCPCEGP